MPLSNHYRFPSVVDLFPEASLISSKSSDQVFLWARLPGDWWQRPCQCNNSLLILHHPFIRKDLYCRQSPTSDTSFYGLSCRALTTPLLQKCYILFYVSVFRWYPQRIPQFSTCLATLVCVLPSDDSLINLMLIVWNPALLLRSLIRGCFPWTCFPKAIHLYLYVSSCLVHCQEENKDMGLHPLYKIYHNFLQWVNLLNIIVIYVFGLFV